MTENDPYKSHAERYDSWFEKNQSVYDAELRAVRELLEHENRRCVEIGVGTGRFAAPLGIDKGVEPSQQMRAIACKRGINVISGVAEALPFKDFSLDAALLVTVICFVNDVHKTFREAFRVLKEGGSLVVGVIDSNSPGGRIYKKKKQESLFYRSATFRSVAEVVEIMRTEGFDDFCFRQTVFSNTSEKIGEEPVRQGYGDGLFVTIRGRKK